MKPTSKIFLYTLITVILIITVENSTIGQENNSDKKRLTGTWEYKISNFTFVLKILENNQLVFDGEVSSYMLVPNAIRVYDEYGATYDYKYTLNDGKLSVNFPDGNLYVFLKHKENPVMELNANTDNASKNLYGSFCHYSSSSGSTSSYSTTKSLYFDGKGNFAYGSQSAYSGDNGIYSSSGSGREFSGTYKVNGKIVTLNFFDGYNYDLKIFFTKQSGEISEVDYDGTVYAKSLCE